MNLPCATKMPGVIASSILTSHILMLVEVWQNKSKYSNKVILKGPASVVNSVLEYHLQQLALEVDEEVYDRFMLTEPSYDIQMNYD